MRSEEFLDALLARLNFDEKNLELIKEKIDNTKALTKTTIYKNLLNMLTHLDVSNKIAKEFFERCFKLQDELNAKLEKPVSLNTALIEYFSRLNMQSKKPFIIELELSSKLAYKKIKDSVTGLCNKKYGYDVLKKEVARTARYGLNLSLLIIDIDNFKSINEKYSHEFGDLLLKHVSEIFKTCVRNVDLIYRSDSNQFVFILPETPALGALEVGNRVRKKLLDDYITPSNSETPVTVKVSGGISSFKIDAENINELVEFAIEALVSAKNDGGNKIYLFFQEKRRFLRLDAYCKVGFQVVEGNSSTSFSKNISAGGLLFEADNFIALNTMIEITIQIPDIDWIITSVGRVIRVEQLPNGKFDLGIFFTEIDPEDQNTILRYIQNKVNPKFNIY